MKLLRTLAAAAAVLAVGACADVPTGAPTDAPVEVDAPRLSLADDPNYGNIVNHGTTYYAATSYYPAYWRVNVSSPGDGTVVASRKWSQYGGFADSGNNPWGFGVYKFVVDRWVSSGPGCITITLKTTFTDGSVKYDYETVKVGRYIGTCPTVAVE